ncbi:MAG: acyl-CoA thioesterase [Gemmatimonadetes bacterium]|nr:MAG: acyl-CoA thioesterase [Gemmatimonadota bacterium]
MPLEFRFRHPVPVRFKDIDIGGHAHHSHALVYFEEARWAYWREVVGRGRPEQVDYILADVRVRYHQRVLYPQTLDVGVRVSGVGRKTFDMVYEVLGEDGTRLVSGASVQVAYDYEAARSVRVSDELRRVLEAFDGPFA